MIVPWDWRNEFVFAFLSAKGGILRVGPAAARQPFWVKTGSKPRPPRSGHGTRLDEYQ
jgi:hypothetical protein